MKISSETYSRIVDEQHALELKINNLEKFLKNIDVSKFDMFQHLLLVNQFEHMCSYNNILCMRLNTLEIE